MSPAAQACFEQWLRLDALCEEGKGDTEEADDLRDEMDKPWYALLPEEHRELDEAIRLKVGKDG